MSEPSRSAATIAQIAAIEAAIDTAFEAFRARRVHPYLPPELERQAFRESLRESLATMARERQLGPNARVGVILEGVTVRRLPDGNN